MVMDAGSRMKAKRHLIQYAKHIAHRGLVRFGPGVELADVGKSGTLLNFAKSLLGNGLVKRDGLLTGTIVWSLRILQTTPQQIVRISRDKLPDVCRITNYIAHKRCRKFISFSICYVNMNVEDESRCRRSACCHSGFALVTITTDHTFCGANGAGNVRVGNARERIDGACHDASGHLLRKHMFDF